MAEFGSKLMENADSSAQLYRRFCQLLVAARKKASSTQTQLAEKLGCRQPLVAKIESGKRRLDVAEFVEVAQAIGVDPTRIIKETC